MARISYREGTTAFRRLLNHAPAVSEAYWRLRKALDESTLPPKIRMLTFLAPDLANRCKY